MEQRPKLIRYYFAKQRERFTLPEDTYADWVILAAHEGRFQFRLAGMAEHEGIAEFGELVLCPPGVTLIRDALGPISFHFIEFAAAPGTLPWPAGKIRIRDVRRLSSTFGYLAQWQEEPMERKLPADAQHLFADLLYLTKREQIQTASARVADPLMDQAAAYMERMACIGDLSLQELAARLGIGASQLTRRFQAAYGLSPVRYAVKLRLSKAQLLLEETNDTLEAIAESCGFQNAFYFSRVFSRHMQISPSAYRRTFRV